MYENFERIPPAEQQRILQVCMEEFARKGYEQASTNQIVQQAGIPKGTLFFFFGSKKGLFFYIIDHAVKEYTRESQALTADLPADLFERLLSLGRARMTLALRQPLIYSLFYNAFLNAPEEIKAELMQRFNSQTSASAQRLSQGLDRAKFKDGVDVDKVIALVQLVLEGLFARYTPVLQRLEPAESLALVERMFTEVETYFELIRRGVYRD